MQQLGNIETRTRAHFGTEPQSYKEYPYPAKWFGPSNCDEKLCARVQTANTGDLTEALAPTL